MMNATSFTPARLLSPPSATILLYAADGLSVWKKHLGPRGFPRTPERAIWVPMFRELINSDEGMHTLHVLTRTGMKAWRCSPDSINIVKSAFRDITLRALLVATLDDYADTGFIRDLMPPLPSRPQPPPLVPRPETPQQRSSEPPSSLPRRPPAPRKSPTPGPG